MWHARPGTVLQAMAASKETQTCGAGKTALWGAHVEWFCMSCSTLVRSWASSCSVPGVSWPATTTSPLPFLFMCLLYHGVYAVGTLRDTHRGAKEALRYWSVTKQHVTQKGGMSFARFGHIVFTQWQDSKLVRFLSTIHIRPWHFTPRQYL